MKLTQTCLALCASAAAFAAPAGAAVTVTFTENSDTDPAAAESMPTPTVVGWNQFVAQGGTFGTVVLRDFFATAPAAFSFTYSLLEPGSNEISDQITFSNSVTDFPTALLITFRSDPFAAVSTVYGSTEETGGPQIIPLPPNMPTGLTGLTVSAQSDLDAVPEPATWAMMLLGFGGIGFALRRRKQEPKPKIAYLEARRLKSHEGWWS